MQQITNEQMKAELASKELTLETMMRTIATVMNGEMCNSIRKDLIAQALSAQDGYVNPEKLAAVDLEKLAKTVNTALLCLTARAMTDLVFEIWGDDTAKAIAHEMDEIGIDGCLEMLRHFIKDCDDVA